MLLLSSSWIIDHPCVPFYPSIVCVSIPFLLPIFSLFVCVWVYGSSSVKALCKNWEMEFRKFRAEKKSEKTNRSRFHYLLSDSLGTVRHVLFESSWRWYLHWMWRSCVAFLLSGKWMTLIKVTNVHKWWMFEWTAGKYFFEKWDLFNTLNGYGNQTWLE